MRAVTHVHSVCGEWDFASPQAARWFAVQLQYELVFYELGMPFTPGRDAREEFADTLFFWEAPASDASAEAVGNCLAASDSLAFQPSSSQLGHRGSDVADEARAPPKHGKDPQLGPGLGFPVCSEGSADACTDLGWVYSAPVFRAPCASQSATPVVHPSALASGSPAIPLRVCFEDGPTRTCNVFRRAFNNTAASVDPFQASFRTAPLREPQLHSLRLSTGLRLQVPTLLVSRKQCAEPWPDHRPACMT